MKQADFEKLVAEGFGLIPERFRNLINNVAIIIEDEPSPGQLRHTHTPRNATLLGLYEGVPQSARYENYTLVPPDKITIFKKPIEEAAGGDPDRVRAIVADTIWHEIAHHFGSSEHRVRRAEQKRKNTKARA